MVLENYIAPTIIKLYESKRRSLIEDVQHKELQLGGDCRHDSPGIVKIKVKFICEPHTLYIIAGT